MAHLKGDENPMLNYDWGRVCPIHPPHVGDTPTHEKVVQGVFLSGAHTQLTMDSGASRSVSFWDTGTTDDGFRNDAPRSVAVQNADTIDDEFWISTENSIFRFFHHGREHAS